MSIRYLKPTSLMFHFQTINSKILPNLNHFSHLLMVSLNNVKSLNSGKLRFFDEGKQSKRKICVVQVFTVMADHEGVLQ